MIPVIHFTYMRINQLPTMEEILSSSTHDEIKELSERYTLISHCKNRYHHDCPMYELLYTDLSHLNPHIKFHQWRILYWKFVKRYGQELIDLLIVKDEEHIRKKIINTLNFAFDELYKTDIIRIEITTSKEAECGESSTPGLIISTLEKSFNIIEEKRLRVDSYFIISKKEGGS